ncbi:hypothetical protein AYO45_01870 [Gammaproteobacteria bacterium SCGC AG-212-F23]|nr:hypothetical protein AYO45_01870 [Gammaproteobacteria bacterium SCGC AG-212-F23]
MQSTTSTPTDAKSTLTSTISTVLDNGAKVVEIWEKLTSPAYSEKERERLTTLKTLYQDNLLGMSSPVFWELDSKHCPTHRIKSQDWSRYVHQLQIGKDNQGYFYYHAKLIAQYASSYLQERGGRNRTENGKSGDLLEQFVSEWIHFALNELPTFDCNERSIQKIKQRLAYIKEVRNYPHLFEYGALTREKNKFDMFVNIEQQLEACLELANQEALRKCARDEFTNCRRETATLLASGVSVLYHLRTTKVHHEPLELKTFSYETSQQLSVAASKIYPRIREFHTGSMLHEVVVKAGLESFGSSATTLKPKPIQLSYFNDGLQPLPIKWDTKKDDLPPWVTDKNKQLLQFQVYSESLLRIAQLKRLIEDAYDLVGGVGDIWAYGDKEGKKSLETLLFLLEAELADFDARFKSLYDYHDKARAAYNHEHKINASDDINRNFGNVTHQKEMIEKASSSLKTIVKSINAQMARFPKDAPQLINEKKKAFYRSISQFIKKFRPEQTDKFAYADEHEASVSPSTISDRTQETTPISLATPTVATVKKLSPALTFTFTLAVKEDAQHKGYYFLDKAEFQPFKYSTPAQTGIESNWQLGGKYEHWTKSYFTRNHTSNLNYQQLAMRFSTAIEQSTSSDEIKRLSAELTSNIQAQKDKIEAERPKWRFKFGFWPIRTKGWPFNRDANEFADKVLNELSGIETQIPTAIAYAEKRINNPQSTQLKNQSTDSSSLDKTLAPIQQPMLTDGLTDSDHEALKSIPMEQKDNVAKMLRKANEPLSSPRLSTTATLTSIPSLPKPPAQLDDTSKSTNTTGPKIKNDGKNSQSPTRNSSMPKKSMFSQAATSMTALMKILAYTRTWNAAMEECAQGNSLKIFYSENNPFNFTELLELRRTLSDSDQKTLATRCYAFIGEITTTLKPKMQEADTVGIKQADLFVELLQILIDPSNQQKIQSFEANLASLGEKVGNQLQNRNNLSETRDNAAKPNTR